MEPGGAGEGGGFGYENLRNNKRLICPATPPLTAIDRFLWGHSFHFNSNQQPRNNLKNKETTPNGLTGGSFSSFSGAISGYGGEVLWPSIQELNIVNEESAVINSSYGRNLNELSEEIIVATKSSYKGIPKKAKKASSQALIKGQWTEEEDR